MTSTSNFLDLVKAEVFLLRKRNSTSILLGIWLAVTAFFPYILEYIFYRSNAEEANGLASMLPDRFAQTVLEGMPFYGGSLVLILGVLSVGSEFGWGNWKTLFTQRPGRSSIFAAKMTALGIALIPFVLGSFLVGAISSYSIASIEGATITWPPVQQVIESAMAGWLVMAVWCAAGVLLATLTRGTSMAIGVGILWALVFEGLIANFATGISWLNWLVDGLLRSNGYSLVQAISPVDGVGSAEGPGRFAGPFVSGMQAGSVLVLYIGLFLGLATWLMNRRDIA